MINNYDKWQEDLSKKQKEANDLIPELMGKDIDEARNIAQEKKVAARVSMIDGKPCILTMDFDPSRLNFEVEKNIVVNITTG